MSRRIEELNNECIINCGIEKQQSDLQSLKKRRMEI
jgi:hypothetical protein